MKTLNIIEFNDVYSRNQSIITLTGMTKEESDKVIDCIRELIKNPGILVLNLDTVEGVLLHRPKSEMNQN